MSTSQYDLEAKVMFLERTLDALNEALVEQNRVIERLELRVQRLEKRAEAKGGPEVGPHDEAPPHY